LREKDIVVKISSSTSAVGGAPESGRTRNTPPAPQQAGAASTERVDISSLSARLQEVGAGEAPVDSQRVAEIKLAITEGRFQVNPERIADGLLASVREMLSAKR
jgi:negative regulator of flagellin synthesis FlgM